MSDTSTIGVNPRRCPQNHRCPLTVHCPVGAVSQRGNGLPSIDEDKCTRCGLCMRVCPYGAFQKTS